MFTCLITARVWGNEQSLQNDHRSIILHRLSSAALPSSEKLSCLQQWFVSCSCCVSMRGHQQLCSRCSAFQNLGWRSGPLPGTFLSASRRRRQHGRTRWWSQSSAQKGHAPSQPHFITKWLDQVWHHQDKGRIIPSQGRAADILSNNLAYCPWHGKIDFLSAVLCKLEVFCSTWGWLNDILLETRKWNPRSFLIFIVVKVIKSLQCPKVLPTRCKEKTRQCGKRVAKCEPTGEVGLPGQGRGASANRFTDFLVNLDPQFSEPPEIRSLCFPCFPYTYSLPKVSHPVRWLEWVCSFSTASFKSQYY